jgi:hypothetical protein
VMPGSLGAGPGYAVVGGVVQRRPRIPAGFALYGANGNRRLVARVLVRGLAAASSPQTGRRRGTDRRPPRRSMFIGPRPALAAE